MEASQRLGVHIEEDFEQYKQEDIFFSIITQGKVFVSKDW